MKRLLLLLLCAACGSKTQAVSQLSYTDPPASGWRLVRSAASSADLLVLDLLPPAGGAGRGMALTLSADPRLTWVKADGADIDLLHPGAVYQLGAEPRAAVGVRRTSGPLVLGLFQKGQTAPAAYGDGSQPVLSVALKLAGPLPPGTALDLHVEKAEHLDTTAALADVRSALAVGKLEAK